MRGQESKARWCYPRPSLLCTGCWTAGLSHLWGCSLPSFGTAAWGRGAAPDKRENCRMSPRPPSSVLPAQRPHLPRCNRPCCAGKAIALVQLRLVFVLQYCKHLAMSYSSSETGWLQVTCIKWSKFTRSCPQMISSLNSKESNFFLSTAGIWWLLELHSGWAARQVFPSFPSWATNSIHAKHDFGFKICRFSSYA